MLEHHGDAGGRPGDPLAEHPQLAGAEIGKPGNATQEGRLTAPAWPDNAEDLLTVNVERELAERHHGAVQEQLARHMRADGNFGIRLRNRHAADVLPWFVAFRGGANAAYRGGTSHLRRRGEPDGWYEGVRGSPCRIALASRMISRHDSSST